MLRLLTGFLLVCVLAIAATAALVLQASPQVVAVDLNQAAAGLAALRAQDPRRLPAGAPASLVLGPREVELLLDRAGGSRLRWQVDFMPQQARLRASLPLPLALWLNAELVLRETDTLPQLERWRLGRLPLPVSLGNRLLRAAAQRLDPGEALADASRLVRRVRFSPGRLQVDYLWQKERLGGAAQAVLAPPADLTRLEPYVARLAAVGAAAPAGTDLPLEQALPPLFALAAQRSRAPADARRENRAALQALALMAQGRSPAGLVPAAQSWPALPQRELTLAGRHDLAQHFVLAALIALEGGEELADGLSLAKELDDARFGSGFSFTDLAAGRAGARFGHLAAGSPLALQQVLAQGVAAQDLLPEVRDLPEFLPWREFQRRYGDPGSAAYRQQMARIEARIASLPLAARAAAQAQR